MITVVYCNGEERAHYEVELPDGERSERVYWNNTRAFAAARCYARARKTPINPEVRTEPA